jgi:hypothetical protein
VRGQRLEVWDLNSERPETGDLGPKQWEAGDWSFEKSQLQKRIYFKVLKRLIYGRKRKGSSRGWTMYSLTSYRLNFSHALRKLEEELTEYRDIWIYCGGFAERQLKLYSSTIFFQLKFDIYFSYKQPALTQMSPVTMCCTYRSSDGCSIWNKKQTSCNS